MRRVLTSVLLAGAMALAVPQPMFAQRGGGGHAGGFSGGGHVGGFGGGHAGGFGGGFSGGGGGARGFGGAGARGFGGGFSGSFSGPRAGFTAPTFQAPRMNFMPRPGGFGNTQRPALVSPGARSSFGQLGYPTVRRVPYPISGTPRAPYPVSGGPTGKSWNGQGWHDGSHNGHNSYRPYYYHGHLFNSWPYYTTGIGNWWLWPWPFSNWDSPSYDDEPQAVAQPDQSYAPEPEPEPETRPAYQSYQPDEPAPPPPGEPALTLVYKDGHSQEIHNYAVTRTSLLLLDEASTGRTPEISLDEINLLATERVNRAAGVNFKVPARN
jgi:hypothetical protein